MVLVGSLAVEFHAVVDGHVVLALLLQHQMGVHIAQLLRDAEAEVDGIPGPHRTKGLLEVGVKAVEQTRQNGSSFLKKSPGQ